MSRRNLRWTVLLSLIVLIISLATYSSWSNHNLINRLLSAHPNTKAQALAELFDRQDRVNRFQSLPLSQRVQIARTIRDWNDERALHLALTLIRDPSEEVRIVLTEGMTNSIKNTPLQAIHVFKTPGVHEQAAILDAIESSGEIGFQTAKTAFENENYRLLASRCLIRIGPKSAVFLTKKILQGDAKTALIAADALHQIGVNVLPAECSERLWSIYTSLNSTEEKNNFFKLIATYPSQKTTPILVANLLDPAAPPSFRVAAAKGLYKLKQLQSLMKTINDPDPDLARTTRVLLVKNNQKSERNLLIPLEKE